MNKPKKVRIMKQPPSQVPHGGLAVIDVRAEDDTDERPKFKACVRSYLEPTGTSLFIVLGAEHGCGECVAAMYKDDEGGAKVDHIIGPRLNKEYVDHLFYAAFPRIARTRSFVSWIRDKIDPRLAERGTRKEKRK